MDVVIIGPPQILHLALLELVLEGQPTIHPSHLSKPTNVSTSPRANLAMGLNTINSATAIPLALLE